MRAGAGNFFGGGASNTIVQFPTLGEWASRAAPGFLAPMGAESGLVSDWRDAAAYRPLFAADRSLIAWEWLRRDRSYQDAADRAFRARSNTTLPGNDPRRWGLLAFEPPLARVPEARPLWSAEIHGAVLKVDAAPPAGGEPFDLERFAAFSTFIDDGHGCQHLLISDGLRAIRLDILSGSLASGPVELAYRLSGLAAAAQPLLALRRLLALWNGGRFSTSLHPPEVRARRWVELLRAHDAIAAGACQRDIAAVMVDADAGEPRWRVRCSSARTRAQRLVQGSMRMASGGYRALLC